MISWIFRKIFKLCGWKVTGNLPKSLKKKIYIAIPHTSNWDFPIGILVKFGFGLDVQYVAKDSLFKPPFGWFFKKTGGIPVIRSKSTNFVDETVKALKNYDRISLCLAPEGTRSKVDKLKSGFYWISFNSGVPLIFVKFDWQSKEMDFSEPFTPSGDYESDLLIIKNHFKDVIGKIPHKGVYYTKDQS